MTTAELTTRIEAMKLVKETVGQMRKLMAKLEADPGVKEMIDNQADVDSLAEMVTDMLQEAE